MLRALFADDASGFLRGLEKFFANLGWEVTAVDDGQKAKQALLGKVFDVVVLDQQMPEEHGNRILRWMASRPEHQYTCVVICTAFGDAEGATEAMKLGAWQYIQKPVKDLGLLEAILLPGVALKRCNRMRSQLLQAQNLQDFFKKFSEICEELGEAGLHLMLVKQDGEIVDFLGTSKRPSSRHAFVETVVKSSGHVFTEDESTTKVVEPIRPDSRTLLAVPVRGEHGNIIGVLDMESSEEHAFGHWWREVLDYIADLIAIFQVSEAKALQAASAMLYRELRHRIATYAQIINMQTRELLEPAVQLNGDTRRRLEIIHRNADTIDAIVRELREAASEHTLTMSAVNLKDVLAEAVEEVHATKRPDPEQPPTVFLGTDALPSVQIRGDRQWLRYCFDCVLENAWEAICQCWKQDPHRADTAKGQIYIAAELIDDTVKVTISDNGIGFDDRDKELLFTPLFSTKTRNLLGEERPDLGTGRISQIFSAFSELVAEDDENAEKFAERRNFRIEIADGDEVSVRISHPEWTEPYVRTARLPGHRVNRGIGLYTTRKVFRQHGGEIEAQSRGVFQGATFTITLPVLD